MSSYQQAREPRRPAADKESFETLFEPNYKSVVYFFLKRCRNREVAMDLAQETFLRAFRSFDRYRGEVEPKSWLFIIATNLWRNRHRRDNALKRSGVEIGIGSDEGEIAADRIEDLVSQPDRDALDRERKEALHLAVESLSPKMRRIVKLRLYQDFKYNEIAQALGVSIQTVRSTLNQAKARLSERLATRFPEIEL